ncbi:MAG: ribosome maturation factor RimP [Spirochaetaceae bacterium]
MKYSNGDPYSEEVIPLLEGLGLQLVELTSVNRKGTLHVHLTIYSPEGVTLDDCAEVYTALLPRLEVLSENRDIHLEVSSPGLGRSIKSGREFELFEGKGVRLLTLDSDDWVGGVIATSDEESVTIRTKAGERTFVYETIKKAKLDESQEEE